MKHMICSAQRKKYVSDLSLQFWIYRLYLKQLNLSEAKQVSKLRSVLRLNTLKDQGI